MKKTLLFALLAFFAASAQVREKGAIEVSPFVGVSSANYYGDSDLLEYNDAVFAPTFGVNANFYLNNRWSLRTGLEYQTMGTSIEYNNLYSNMNTEEKLNFVALPIHASYHFGSTRKWYLNFGPTLDFLTSASSNGEDIKEGIKSVQFGLGIGIGYKFYINEHFSIGIDHQEYISFVNNLSLINKGGPFIGNIFGSFSVKAVFTLGSKKSTEE